MLETFSELAVKDPDLDAACAAGERGGAGERAERGSGRC